MIPTLSNARWSAVGTPDAVAPVPVAPVAPVAPVPDTAVPDTAAPPAANAEDGAAANPASGRAMMAIAEKTRLICTRLLPTPINANTRR